MKTFFLALLIFLLLGVINITTAQNNSFKKDNSALQTSEQKDVFDLISLLTNLAAKTNNKFYQNHFLSIIKVINANKELTAYELKFIDSLYKSFSDTSVVWDPSKLSSYLERKRPFIVSWTSPTDGVVSLGWLIPPENWDTTKAYPLYIRLHGLYDPYQDPIEYMARYISPKLIIAPTFEDGFSFYPWGRGNIWYEDIGETDIWESISAVENLVHINPARKYLTGHSMGGYGAWKIGQGSPGVWAAIGIYAGALWYNNGRYLNLSTAEKLNNVPVYIVCGDADGLLSNNQTAYNLLLQAGNDDIFFTTFNGGHESLLENWQNMYAWMKTRTKDTLTSIYSPKINYQYELYDSYPNPFNPTTVISYSLPEAANVKLEIYNLLGQEISTLVDKQEITGFHKIVWNAQNLPGGVYFCKIKTYPISTKQIFDKAIFEKTKKLLLLK